MTRTHETRVARAWAHAVAATAAAGLALSLAACGTDADARDRPAGAPGSEVPAADDRTTPVVTSTGRLPAPVAGVVQVDGDPDSLTPIVRRRWARQGGVAVEKDSSGSDRAYEGLCLGAVDVVDSSRPISPDEWAQCEANGLEVHQLRVAADALVVAIQNQTDVGGDCLSTDQARDVYTAGSMVDTWSQVGDGFDDVPLEAGGPTVDSGTFQFFGSAVLEAEEPSSASFRADYVASHDEDDTRLFVVGSDADKLASGGLDAVTPRYRSLKKELRAWWQVVVDADAEVHAALANRAKGVRDGRPPADRAADEERVQRAYAARAAAVEEKNRIRARFQPVSGRYHRAFRATKRLDATVGHVGLFQFSYYQVYENLLRPFEVEVADGDGRQDCIFPSAQTIVSGQYPLSRQLLLTTTSRSLERTEVASFLQYYLRHAGAAAEDSRVIALPVADVLRQLRWIATGDVPVSTSVDGGPVVVQDPDADAVTGSEDAPDPGTEAPTPETEPVEKPAR